MAEWKAEADRLAEALQEWAEQYKSESDKLHSKRRKNNADWAIAAAFQGFVERIEAALASYAAKERKE